MDQQRIALVLSTLLLLAVQLNVVAQGPGEVSIQAARSTTTIKCATGEHHLAIVKAFMPKAGPEGNASAFGFALVPANGDVKMFARYWFFFPGKALSKRDDDNGQLGEKLIDGSSSKDRVDNFFANCSADNDRPIITAVLDQAT